MNDEFVKIPEYENYSINRLGVVRNDFTGKVITPKMNTSGYYEVRMQQNAVRKCHKVHRLLAIMFIPNPENKPIVDHIDRNTTNNSLNNLRWATCPENSRNKRKLKDTLSMYRGVYYSEKRNGWRAYITINKKMVWIKQVQTEVEAAQIYNNYIIEHKLEEFFVLNEIPPK